MSRSITTAKGAVVSVEGDSLRINGKFAGRLEDYAETAECPMPPQLLAILRRYKRDPATVIMHCLQPANIVCTPEVAELIREGKVEVAAARAAEEKRRADAEQAAIAACPEGFEPARWTGEYDGNTFVEAVADGAKTCLYGDVECQPTTAICYVRPQEFANARKRMERIAADEDAWRLEVDAARIQARESGKPVILRRWTTDRCHNGHDDECSFDNATEWMLPDGTTKITYRCCY